MALSTYAALVQERSALEQYIGLLNTYGRNGEFQQPAMRHPESETTVEEATRKVDAAEKVWLEARAALEATIEVPEEQPIEGNLWDNFLGSAAVR